MSGFQFLSHENFQNKDLIISACQEHLKIPEDKNIVEMLLEAFLADDWSFLSSQEIHFLNFCPTSEWVDYLIYRWKFKNHGKLKIVPKFPTYLLVEPSSICNLKCSMCFQCDKSFSSDDKYLGFMDFDLFKRVIDEAVLGGTKAITLASRGEPTLNPNFGKMLEYCADKFYEIKVNTNAILLNTELIYQMLKAKVRILVFSVDAYDDAGYQKIRKSDKFQVVLENIKKFHEIRKKHYPNSVTITRAHGVKVSNDFNEEKFHSFWGEIVDEVSLMECLFRWDSYSNALNNKKEPCERMFDSLYIWFDGICNPCDIDYKSYLAMGTVKENTISEIWNGKKYVEFRNTFNEGKRSTMVPCNKCNL